MISKVGKLKFILLVVKISNTQTKIIKKHEQIFNKEKCKNL